MLSRISFWLAAAVCTMAVPALSSASASAAPVSYVFFSAIGTDYPNGPNNVYSLAVSSEGSFKLAGMASAPGPIYHLSVTKKFLFGIDGASNIYTYSISSTGALKLVATTNAGKHVPGFAQRYSSDLLQVDETGSTIYCLIPTSQTSDLLASFKIESSGELEFLGTSYADPNAFSQIRFVQNNKFALINGCYNTAAGASFVTDSNDVNDIVTYKRESNGYLSYIGTSNETPTAQSPYEYCAGLNASDPTEHLAVVFGIFNPPGDDEASPPFALGTYTVNSKGEPSTTSDYENMATTDIDPNAISIDPTGKLLALGGQEAIQFFHFNGGSPITSYSGKIDVPNYLVQALGWDKSSHFFLLTGDAVEAYKVTPTSYTKLDPWEIPNLGTTSTPYSMIVLTVD